jgi:REP element-mobilizing transposase RayT
MHLAFENAHGWNEPRANQLEQVRSIIVGWARKKSWQLSRIGLLANHIHILLSAAATESPKSVAISLMNNIAYVCEMSPILKFSYYAGTFGGHDRGAI